MKKIITLSLVGLFAISSMAQKGKDKLAQEFRAIKSELNLSEKQEIAIKKLFSERKNTLKPQSEFIMDENHNILVSDLFLYENMDDCVSSVSSKLERVLEIKHLNKSSRSNDLVLDDEAKCILLGKYRLDFELYNSLVK